MEKQNLIAVGVPSGTSPAGYHEPLDEKMKFLYLLTIAGLLISFVICRIYEGRIKRHLKKEKITDNFDQTSMAFLSLFSFYLSDYEGKVKDPETINDIKNYKVFQRAMFGFAGALAVTHILSGII